MVVWDGVIGIDEVGLTIAGAGAVFREKVAARNVSGLEALCVEDDRGSFGGEPDAPVALKIGNVEGFRCAAPIDIALQDETGRHGGSERKNDSRLHDGGFQEDS